jgi:hypothetical protein
MDPDVHGIIEAEKQRQKRCVNLIASVARKVVGGPCFLRISVISALCLAPLDILDE